jgi:hypothetical protein
MRPPQWPNPRLRQPAGNRTISWVRGAECYTTNMNRVLSLYLAATIFACPLYCWFAKCGAAVEGTTPVCSCCHGGGSHGTPANAPTAPGPQPSDSGGSCQCICGGAVVDHANANVADIDTSWWLPVAIISPRVAHTNEMPFDCFCRAPWPDDGMNVGRSLCCLYSTLLC